MSFFALLSDLESRAREGLLRQRRTLQGPQTSGAEISSSDSSRTGGLRPTVSDADGVTGCVQADSLGMPSSASSRTSGLRPTVSDADGMTRCAQAFGAGMPSSASSRTGGLRPTVSDADGKSYLAFCSNDYLGLANHPQLIAAMQQGVQQYGVGAGAAHLVSGHTQAHHQLESQLASFANKPAALLFSTGYMANLGVVQALVGKGDTVFADKLNHASLNDAMLLSRAEVQRYRHNDMSQLAMLLEKTRSGRKLIITDAVFSMDGDLAPLPELLALCEQHDAWLLVDDAHGFGVLGEQGRGSLAHFGIESQRIIYMATLGKAAGVFGAFVAAEQVVIDTLINHARSYVYTTATPPALATALQESLRLITQGNDSRAHLQRLIARLRSGLRGLPWQLMPSATAIQPLLIGGNQDAMDLGEGLRERGIWVAAIRPPTVPQGTARLRITLSAAHSEADVTRLISALHELAC